MFQTQFKHPCAWVSNKCILAGSGLPLSQVCPTIKSQSLCPKTLGCRWFALPDGCQATPYCKLKTAKACAASTGCKWVATSSTAGVCGLAR
jgi:hypothetical protein